jgi:hypothetical protein
MSLGPAGHGAAERLDAGDQRRHVGHLDAEQDPAGRRVPGVAVLDQAEVGVSEAQPEVEQRPVLGHAPGLGRAEQVGVEAAQPFGVGADDDGLDGAGHGSSRG